MMHVTKLATYHGEGVLSSRAVVIGLALGPIMVLGAYLGKRVVDRMSPRVFVWIVDIIVAGFGLLFLIHG
jgi:uncharacterized membrane protein YfcA